MRRALLLSLSVASTSYSVTGDWKIWSQVGSARQTVVRAGQTVLAATSGGIISWAPATSSGKVMTNLDGLPTLDIASIVADSAGSIWAIGTDGRMAVLAPGATNWRSVGSNNASQWTFSPGAALFWNHYLVMGGPQGLTLFSTTKGVADDYVSTFGSIRDTVTAVFASGDSLWVATPSGMAIATDPVWGTDSAQSHLGRAGYYLNSVKWSVVRTPLPDSLRIRYRIRRDSSGVHQVLAGQWSNYDRNLVGLKLEYGRFTGPGIDVNVPGARDAVSTNWGYFLSTSSNGLVQVTADGTTNTLSPAGAFNDFTPTSVALGSSGVPILLSGGDPFSARIWRRNPAGSWVPETLKVALPSTPGTLSTPLWDVGNDTSASAKPLAVGPDGMVGLGAWEYAPTGGGFYVSTAIGSWTAWNNVDDTCIPKNSDNGVSVRGLHGGSNGIWASLYRNSRSMAVVHLPSGGGKPGCLSIDASGSGIEEFHALDLLEIGDTLWLATLEGLIRAQGIQTSPGITKPSGTVSAWKLQTPLKRLTSFHLAGKTWIVAGGSGFLGALPVDALESDNFQAVQKTSQDYISVTPDAQGNIWAAGTEGLDIWTPQLDDSGALQFSLSRKIRYEDGLPNERILDLALDSSTGKAVIATSAAVAVWTSPYRPVPAKLAKSSVRVWPNPVRLRQTRTLYVDGATLSSQFDLFSADGTLVLHQNASQSASFQIQLPSTSKMRPGIYYWSLKDSRGSIHGPLLVGE